MQNGNIKNGDLINDTRFNKIYVVTSVTEKRINLDDAHCVYTSTTGRNSSKFYLGHKSFSENIASGRYIIQ